MLERRTDAGFGETGLRFSMPDPFRRPVGAAADDDWLAALYDDPPPAVEPAEGPVESPEIEPTIVADAPRPLAEAFPKPAVAEGRRPAAPRQVERQRAVPQPSAATGSEAGPIATNASRSVTVDQHNTIDVHLDPTRLIDEIESRLQPKLEELALRLARRLDDQFSRVLFTQQTHGP